jgi:hypothetical protein
MLMNTLENTIVDEARSGLNRLLRSPVATPQDRDRALATFHALCSLCRLADVHGSGLSEQGRAELQAIRDEASRSLNGVVDIPNPPSSEELLSAFDVSKWLKSSLSAAMDRDPVDAARDAELLHQVLEARLSRLTDAHKVPTNVLSKLGTASGRRPG